jgi:acetate kinase
MTSAILVLNAGSSSLKFALRDAAAPDRRLLAGDFEELGTAATFRARDAAGAILVVPPVDPGASHATALALLLPWLRQVMPDVSLVAAGHRVVHGGAHFTAPVVIDEGVLAALDALVPLAPLHQPHNLAAIRAVAAAAPRLPQVACFDTAFHATIAPVVQAFALPKALADEGIRRYGFHGLSYQAIANRLPALLGPVAEGRVIVAHLGNGASLCAMQGRRSMATTMGFTALDGLVMGTRSGSIDPGVLLHLMAAKGWDGAHLTRLLYRESGLLGLSGLSSDMRALLASDDEAARFAVQVFVHRVVREIGALAATIGGLDALVFTAGIGEHAAPVRAAVMEGCRWLGIVPDATANASHGPRISQAGPATAWVVPTDEEGVIAGLTATTLSTP